MPFIHIHTQLPTETPNVPHRWSFTSWGCSTYSAWSLTSPPPRSPLSGRSGELEGSRAFRVAVPDTGSEGRTVGSRVRLGASVVLVVSFWRFLVCLCYVTGVLVDEEHFIFPCWFVLTGVLVDGPSEVTGVCLRNHAVSPRKDASQRLQMDLCGVPN